MARTILLAWAASAALAFEAPAPARPPTRLGAGFGKATVATKAKQIDSGPKPMDKQWDNYFALTEDAAAVTKEVWITTPGGERPLPLGFAACRAGGDVAEAVALQKALILWCAEGLHPKLAPFLRGKAKGEVALELAFCDVAVVSDEEREKELAAGEAAPEGKPPGGPLTMLGTVKPPPSLGAKDVGFMPFKSPIQANQASVKQSAAKREMSSGKSKKR